MDRAATPDRRLLTGQFTLLMVGSGLFFSGFGILNALVPPYVVDVLEGSEATAGFVMGSFAITSLCSRPFVGRIADRHGPRRVLVGGAVIGVVAMLLLRVGPDTLATVVASRLVLGVSGAAMFTGSALLSIMLAPPDRQGRAASLMLVSVHVGLGLGPVIGIRIQQAAGYGSVWLVVAGAAAAGGIVLALIDRTTPADGRVDGPLVHRAALVPGVVTFFGVFAFNGFITFASLYGREVGVGDVALLFTAASGTIVLVRVTAGHVPDVIGPIRAGTGALVLTTAATLLLALWQTPTGLFVGAIAVAAGLSLQTPSFMPLALAGVPDEERGSAMATFTAFYDLANAVIGPTVGLIVAGAGYRVAFSTTAFMSVVALVILRRGVAPGWTARQAPARERSNPASV
ncbi:MAG: MFS transporter [Ilumatobacteraceae bacterium]